MSRGYSATPLWGLSRNSAVAGVFSWMLLKRGAGSGERGAGSGERGAGNGERGTGNGERGTEV